MFLHIFSLLFWILSGTETLFKKPTAKSEKEIRNSNKKGKDPSPLALVLPTLG